jgi:TonB family protein
VHGGDGGEVEQGMPKPALKPAEATTSGGYDKVIIRRVINQKKSETTNCYLKELVKEPALKGRITIKWRITAKGEVESVEVASNEMGNDAVAQCLVTRIKGWKFPAPKGGGTVDVSYPFTFDSK